MRSRKGFTLVETLIVVVILGLIVLVGFPKMSAAMVKTDLRGARTSMINLMAKARGVAAQSNRLTRVEFQDNRAYIVASPRRVPPLVPANEVDTVGAILDFTKSYHVTLTPPSNPIQFDPRGFGSNFGGSEEIVLSRGGYSERITIDALGRVAK